MAAVSFVGALKDKYCPQEGPPDPLKSCSIAIYMAPGAGCPLERRRSVVLDSCDVSSVGEGLEGLCPLVEELHLSSNQLSDWSNIAAILQSLPRLVFLDLARNPLSSNQIAGPMTPCTHLLTLVLNDTNTSWSALDTILTVATNLKELHIAHNGYTNISLSSTICHHSLRRLQIQCNSISQWSELHKLSPAFPLLQTLIACDNPLSSVTCSDVIIFPELTLLGLNNTMLSDWTSFEYLAQLGKLSELNVLRVPVAEVVNDDKKTRFAIISRMPCLSKLNKTAISDTEREEAERWLLREYADQPHPPTQYAHYLAKHGVVGRLVDVDLSPRETVQLEFHFKDGREKVTKSVKMDQTILELRQWVAKVLLGDASAEVKLLYVDCMGWDGMQVLSLSGRKLHSYREMRDGDQVHVQILPPCKFERPVVYGLGYAQKKKFVSDYS